MYDRSNGTLFSVGEDKKILRWKRNQNGKFELKNTYEGIHGFAIFTIALLKRDWVVTVRYFVFREALITRSLLLGLDRMGSMMLEIESIMKEM